MKGIISHNILYIFSIWGLFSQTIQFEHYNDANGLSHNSVRHIVQDKNGFLWLGTFSGLNRFDGYQIKSFMSSSSVANTIPNDDITALEYDEESNNLWIGTRNGLTLLDIDTQEFTTFLPNAKDAHSLQDHEIRSVHIDRFNQIWVGTKNKGLFVYNQDQNIFEKIELQGFVYIKEIFEDTKGQLWIGSYGTAGVAKITLDNVGNPVKIDTYTLNVPNSKEINPYVNFIYQNSNLDIFVGSRQGLYKFNEESNQFTNLYIKDVKTRDKLGPYFISIARAPDGKYWLGTLGGILVVDNLEDITEENYEWYYSELSNSDSLIDDLVYELYFDELGLLWIGTENGLDKYDPFSNQFRVNKGISKYLDNQVPRIRGFSKTFDDKVIVATRHNGLFVVEDDNSCSSCQRVLSLHQSGHDIASIYSSNGKIFYCGLWNGNIFIYDYLANTSKVVEIGLGTTPILAFANLGNNKMAVGSHGEGSIFFNTELDQPEKSEGILLSSREINQIAVDSIGSLWYATQTGIIKYDPLTNKAKVYSPKLEGKTGLSHGNVSDVAIDRSGNIWAATRKGLDYYDPSLDDFIPVIEPKDLNGTWITNVVTDNKDHLWLNMNNNRLARYNTITKELNMYYTDSGNRLDIFSSRGFYYASDDHMYLAGKDGILSFSPKNLKDNDKSPPPVITDIRIQNNEIEIGDVLNDQLILKEDINKGRTLILEHDNKNFSLTFSHPSYTNERFNKYSYRLVGFDNQWTTVDIRQRTVQYTNLFFGDYGFEVRAMNSHGVWSPISTYDIKILPPFWLTYKALLLALLVISVVFYFVRKQIRARLILKQELLLEKVKRERDEKLNNEKLKFFTNISHELITPLTLILGPAKQLIEEGKESGNKFQQSRFNLIHQNANRLLNLVNQVLDFRRAQSGELQLKVTKTNIFQRTTNTFRSFQELADDKKINFNIVCDNQEMEGYLDWDKYDKILYNLLSNALKFTHQYGHVDLFVNTHLENNEQKLVVEVSDDGIGIRKESQAKIFSRFFQASNSKENNTGSGIGLSLVKALVELHKGTIEVESELEKGSTFTLKIPISKKAYLKDEIFEVVKPDTPEESPQLITAKKIIQSTHLKERILIIEDNIELRNYLVEYLSDHYKVFEAENGKVGLEQCRKVKPVLCIADIMMPEMDGLEFCRILKNDDDISHVPVILLTALSDSDDKIRGYSSGADGYLVKPFEPSLLKTRIENIIKSRMELKNKFSVEVDSEVTTLTHSPADEMFMENLTQLIKNDMSNLDLNTTFLCHELGMSSSKLYRKIKEITDLAPNEFIRTIRLKKAAHLLNTKKYNVSEVTGLVGFNDPLYFSRCFKKQFGYPPSNLIK